MRYAVRLRPARRRHAAWLCRKERTSGWRARYPDTRRCQQNPMRWFCLWKRKQR